MMNNPQISPVMATAFVGLASLFGIFFTKLYRARSYVRDLRRRGLPVAPNHSFFFGHLLYLKKYVDKLPPEAHYLYPISDIYLENFQKEGAFYLDMWPINPLFLAVFSPDTATSVTQTNPHICSQRPETLPDFFKPIAGGPNLFDMPESDWKAWRGVFNKGFNTEHCQSLVPGMVKQTLIFRETMREHARKGDIFYLDTTTLRFMIDMIGQTILNAELGAQNGYNTLADCMISQIRWIAPTGFNPFASFNLARGFMHWWNSRQMNLYIGQELDRRYLEYKDDTENKRSRAVIDLVLQAYFENDTGKTNEELDADFRAFAIRQIRLFVYVGHDSTSSTICYCIHLLSKNADALAKLRAEHNAILGEDIDTFSSTIIEQPQLLNDLTYTNAIIKETLRFFPPANGVRQGSKLAHILDDTGNSCPTDGAMIWVGHMQMQTAPKYWVRPLEFLPERWLVEPGHELYPLKGAWRPFEQGPRNCIAQGLVMIELKVVLAHLVREFDFENSYDEWDIANPRKGLKICRGERAFQIDEGAAHPAEHYPCKVSFHEHKEN
ncbi:hypothetical protein HYFRA_00004198 [Hymenoscyphus fraxineus]|uniref:Uncharacterized protein n=1 Tax=Hymenoscyphus fraxineus TaxID=746836 RepID=A0A9N9KLF5_9HELO|nr:hypothetical protein HYFRA_00004198 [Hymenoscyphus fraxineus]